MTYGLAIESCGWVSVAVSVPGSSTTDGFMLLLAFTSSFLGSSGTTSNATVGSVGRIACGMIVFVAKIKA